MQLLYTCVCDEQYFNDKITLHSIEKSSKQHLSNIP